MGWVAPAGADLAFEAKLAQLVLQGGVIVGHDVLIALALGAIAAWGSLLPALALAQMQPAGGQPVMSVIIGSLQMDQRIWMLMCKATTRLPHERI